MLMNWLKAKELLNTIEIKNGEESNFPITPLSVKKPGFGLENREELLTF